MCDQCLHIDLPVEEASAQFDANLSSIASLQRIATTMLPRDRQFAEDLLHTFTQELNLSPRQWFWVSTLLSRYQSAEPIYGSFNAILVMFRMAQSHGLKRPRIRLLSDDPEPVYFELWFRPGERDEKLIEIQVGGWQSHGKRRFGGWVHHDRILPWRQDRITTGIRNTIQALSLDPAGVAKAMAAKIGACLYCGARLTDDESKARGYGPTCAENWGQPWGTRTADTQAAISHIRTSTLQELFS